MKRLITADWHLHTWGYCSKTTNEGFNNRLINQYHAARQMINNAEELGVKYIYFAGDLFHQHSNISTQVLTIASKIIKEIRIRGIKIRAISGNHDQYNRAGTIHALQFLADEEISRHWEDDGLEVLGLPYTSDEEVLKRFLEGAGKGDKKLVLLHQGVAGTPLSSGYVLNDILTPAMIPDNVQAFTGHYHFFKKVSSNLTVVGNLVPINWNDLDQKKGWLIYDDETNEIYQEIQQTSPSFVQWDPKKNTDLSLLKNNYIYYIQPVKAKEQEEIRKSLIEKGALAVEFSDIKINKNQDYVRSEEKITIDSVIKKFEDQCKGRRKDVGVEIREEKYNIKSV